MRFIYYYTISFLCKGFYVIHYASHVYTHRPTCVRVNDGKDGQGESKNTWSMINASTLIMAQRHHGASLKTELQCGLS